MENQLPAMLGTMPFGNSSRKDSDQSVLRQFSAFDELLPTPTSQRCYLPGTIDLVRTIGVNPQRRHFFVRVRKGPTNALC